jgi:Domain of unknown function (DUF955).
MLNRLEELEAYAESLGIVIDDSTLQKEHSLDGLYIEVGGNCIVLVNRHRTQACQYVALAEEIGHFFRSTGNIVKLSTVAQRKSENAGKAWAIEFLLPICKFTYSALFHRCKTAADFAAVHDFPVEFVAEAIAYYQRKGQWIYPITVSHRYASIAQMPVTSAR